MRQATAAAWRSDEKRRLLRASRVIGWGSLIWFGLSFAIGYVLDVTTVDVSPVIVLTLLPSAYHGGRTSWRVILVLLLLYSLVGLGILTALVIRPGLFSASFATTLGGRATGIAVSMAVCMWALAGVRVSFQSLDILRRRERRSLGQCELCGYDLRGTTSERCPECGSRWEASSTISRELSSSVDKDAIDSGQYT